MWCAPTNPGPTRPMPTRVISRERLFRELETLLHFLDRRPLSAIFILDVGANRPPFFLEQLQGLPNGRLPLAPGHVVALALPPVFEVEVRDVGVMCRDVCKRVEVRGREVADVEVDLEELRQLHRRGEA